MKVVPQKKRRNSTLLSSGTSEPTKTLHTNQGDAIIHFSIKGYGKTRNYAVSPKAAERIIPVLEELQVETVGELSSFEEEFLAETGLPIYAINLRGLREREDLTQEEFGKRINVDRVNISHMERGKRSIGKDIAKRIAQEFDTDYRLFL